MQLAHQLGAAKLLNPAAKASSKMAEVSPTARPPTKSMRAEAVMPIHTVLLRPWRRPKRITALSESHPPSGAIRAMAINGVAPNKPPLGTVRLRTRERKMKNQGK